MGTRAEDYGSLQLGMKQQYLQGQRLKARYVDQFKLIDAKYNREKVTAEERKFSANWWKSTGVLSSGKHASLSAVGSSERSRTLPGERSIEKKKVENQSRGIGLADGSDGRRQLARRLDTRARARRRVWRGPRSFPWNSRAAAVLQELEYGGSCELKNVLRNERIVKKNYLEYILTQAVRGTD